jgi:hypothetical protein
VAEDGVTRGAVIEAAGHRSDVRAVALSSDDACLLSASSAAVKVQRCAECSMLLGLLAAEVAMCAS